MVIAILAPGRFLGGGCTLHQFTRVGRLVVIGGNEPATKDIPPFGAVWERRLKGYNAVGCRRAGLSREAIKSIRSAYQLLHSNRSTNTAVAAIERQVERTQEVAEILGFHRREQTRDPPDARRLARRLRRRGLKRGGGSPSAEVEREGLEYPRGEAASGAGPWPLPSSPRGICKLPLELRDAPGASAGVVYFFN